MIFFLCDDESLRSKSLMDVTICSLIYERDDQEFLLEIFFFHHSCDSLILCVIFM